VSPLSVVAFLAVLSGPPPAVVPTSVQLDVDRVADALGPRVRCRLELRVDAPVEGVRLYFPAQYELRRLRDEDDRPLTFRREGDELIVEGEGLLPGTTHVWSLLYRWTLGRPLLESAGAAALGPWYPAVPIEVRGPFEPGFVSHPSRVRIAVPPGLAAVSTGRLELEDEGRTFVWTATEPQPVHPLLIARLAMREYVAGDRELLLFLPEEHLELAHAVGEFALAATGFYARSFAPIDRPGLTLALVPLGQGHGGMTFPGLTLLSSSLLEDGFPSRILAHELGHHWWALGVGFPDLEDGWLREGLPTYSGLLFVEEREGADRLREELRHSHEIATRVPDIDPLSRGFDVPPEAVYPQNYHRAASVLHLLRLRLGRDAFLALLREFYLAHEGGNASAAAFRGFVEEAGRGRGMELEGFFRDWVERAELPEFEVTYAVGAAEAGAHPVRGVVRQGAAAVAVSALLRFVSDSGETWDLRVDLSGPATRFEAACPFDPAELVFDPDADILHRGAAITRQP